MAQCWSVAYTKLQSYMCLDLNTKYYYEQSQLKTTVVWNFVVSNLTLYYASTPQYMSTATMYRPEYA